MRVLGGELLGNYLNGEQVPELVVIPDSYLHYLPFAALDISGRSGGYSPLIETHNVQYASALSLEPVAQHPA